VKVPVILPCCLLVANACGQPEEVTKPEAPDMDELIAAYERPTGSFNPETIAELRREFDARVEELEQSDLVKQLEDSLGTTLQEAEAGASGSSTRQRHARLLDFDGSGFLRVTRICNGWTEPPVPDRKANGFMEFVIGFTDSHLDPVVFGTLSQCRYLSGSAEALFTTANENRPALNIHLGNTEGSSDFGEHPITFEVNLRGNLDDESKRIQFDFRVMSETGAIEHRLEADGGSIVTAAAVDGGVHIRAGNGEFTCTSDFDCRVAGTDAGAAE
jgi:hypothetical protein